MYIDNRNYGGEQNINVVVNNSYIVKGKPKYILNINQLDGFFRDLNFDKSINFSYFVNPSNPSDVLGSVIAYPFDIRVFLHQGLDEEYPNKNISITLGRFTFNSAKAWDSTIDKNWLSRIYLGAARYNIAKDDIAYYFNNIFGLSLYVPYFGTLDIDIKQFIKRIDNGNYLFAAHLFLTVDFNSGIGSLQLSRDSKESDETILNYISRAETIQSFDAQLGIEIPFSSFQNRDITTNWIQKGISLGKTAISFASGFLGGGGSETHSTASKATSGGTFTKTKTNKKGEPSVEKYKRPRKVVTQEEDSITSYHKGNEFFINTAANGITNIFESIPISVNNNVSNNISNVLTCYPQPYLISKKYFKILNSSHKHLVGKPLKAERKLNEVHGYTEISHIRFINSKLNIHEQSVITELLQNGVYFPEKE